MNGILQLNEKNFSFFIPCYKFKTNSTELHTLIQLCLTQGRWHNARLSIKFQFFKSIMLTYFQTIIII